VEAAPDSTRLRPYVVKQHFHVLIFKVVFYLLRTPDLDRRHYAVLFWFALCVKVLALFVSTALRFLCVGLGDFLLLWFGAAGCIARPMVFCPTFLTDPPTKRLLVLDRATFCGL